MSDPIEKWAGAGDEPNGSRVSSTPISSLLSSFHIAIHFDAIFGVTWNRLYAFSMSILLHRMCCPGLCRRMLCMRCMYRRRLYP